MDGGPVKNGDMDSRDYANRSGLYDDLVEFFEK
jgi:hypothetical protein